MKFGSGPAAVIPVLAESEDACFCLTYATGPVGLGRQAEEGEPEDLHGCSRTVFGAKIMCGLIFSINPQSCKKTGDFLFVQLEPRELRSHGPLAHGKGKIGC